MRGSCWSTEDWREGSRQCQETSKIGYHDECLIYVEVFGRLKEQVFNVALKARWNEEPKIQKLKCHFWDRELQKLSDWECSGIGCWMNHTCEGNGNCIYTLRMFSAMLDNISELYLQPRFFSSIFDYHLVQLCSTHQSRFIILRYF
jgi:hypothetical protein